MDQFTLSRITTPLPPIILAVKLSYCFDWTERIQLLENLVASSGLGSKISRTHYLFNNIYHDSNMIQMLESKSLINPTFTGQWIGMNTDEAANNILIESIKNLCNLFPDSAVIFLDLDKINHDNLIITEWFNSIRMLDEGWDHICLDPNDYCYVTYAKTILETSKIKKIYFWTRDPRKERKHQWLPIKIYYHITDLPGWYDLVTNKIQMLKDNGLWDLAESIHLQLHYDPHFFQEWVKIFATESKVKIKLYTDSHRGMGECWSIRQLWLDCQSDQRPYAVFRYHTKGLWVSQFPEFKVWSDKWNEYLDYWNIERWHDHYRALVSGYDTSGVNWHPPGEYAGNIWWAHSDHIRQLPLLVPPNKVHLEKQIPAAFSTRHDSELWIGLRQNIKYNELHHHWSAMGYDEHFVPKDYRIS